MSRRSRILEILAAKDLADSDVERAQAQGARNAQSAAGWGNALSGLVQAASTTVPKAVSSYADDESARLANDLVLKNAGHAGEIDPGKVADRPTPQYQLPPLLTPQGPFKLGDKPRNPLDAFKPPPTPAEALRTEERPIVGGPSADLFAPSRYLQTPAQLARKLVTDDDATKGPNQEDSGFFGMLDRNVRTRAQEAAEAKLAQDITRQRAQEDAVRRAKGLHDEDRELKVADLNLKVGKFHQDEDHFTRGETGKLEAAKADRSFRHGERVEGQGFTSGENEKNRGAAETRARILASAQTAKTDAPKPLPQGAIDSIADLNTAEKNAAGILQRASAFGDNIGRTDAGLNSAAQLIGQDDPKYSAWRSDLKALVADYKKAMSGAGVSDREAADILSTMPNDTDSPERFRAKMQAFQARVRNTMTGKLAAYKATNHATAGLEKLVGTDADKIQDIP